MPDEQHFYPREGTQVFVDETSVLVTRTTSDTPQPSGPPETSVPVVSLMEGGANWPGFTLHERYPELGVIGAQNIGGAHLFGDARDEWGQPVPNEDRLTFKPELAEDWAEHYDNSSSSLVCLDEEGPAVKSYRGGQKEYGILHAKTHYQTSAQWLQLRAEFLACRTFFQERGYTPFWYTLLNYDNPTVNIGLRAIHEDMPYVWSPAYITGPTDEEVARTVGKIQITRDFIESLDPPRPKLMLGIRTRFVAQNANHPHYEYSYQQIPFEFMRDFHNVCIEAGAEAIGIWSGGMWYYGYLLAGNTGDLHAARRSVILDELESHGISGGITPENRMPWLDLVSREMLDRVVASVTVP